jgi:hypothetical protein
VTFEPPRVVRREEPQVRIDVAFGIFVEAGLEGFGCFVATREPSAQFRARARGRRGAEGGRQFRAVAETQGDVGFDMLDFVVKHVCREAALSRLAIVRAHVR